MDRWRGYGQWLADDGGVASASPKTGRNARAAMDFDRKTCKMKRSIATGFSSVEKEGGRRVMERGRRRGLGMAWAVLRGSGGAEVQPGASPVTMQSLRGEERVRDGLAMENCGDGRALTGNKEYDGGEGKTERERRWKQVKLVRNLATEIEASLYARRGSPLAGIQKDWPAALIEINVTDFAFERGNGG